MLGFGDLWSALAWFGAILAPIVCIVYGAYMWNKGGEEE
ncbi:symporter small accessory protein [Halobacillus naozhouensis]